jgi:transcription elongation factor GreA
VDQKVYVTQAVYDGLQAELTDIEQVRKPQVARLLGSLSSEIEPEDRSDATVEEQMELLERREAEIRDTLAAAEVVPKPKSNDIVAIGSTVTLDEDGTQHSYTIVGSVGADADRGWITTESPLGAGLFGHCRGDNVTIAAPSGPRMLTIVAIE